MFNFVVMFFLMPMLQGLSPATTKAMVAAIIQIVLAKCPLSATRLVYFSMNCLFFDMVSTTFNIYFFKYL